MCNEQEASNNKIFKNSANEFNHVMTKFREGKISCSGTVHQGLNILKLFLESSHHKFGTPYFDMESFYSALQKTGFGGEVETRRQELLSGCMIEALVRIGCSKRQARNFFRTYWGGSLETAEQRHLIFLNYMEDEEQFQNPTEFIIEFSDWLEQKTQERKKQLVNVQKFPKADKAFGVLSAALLFQKNWEKENCIYVQRLSPYDYISSNMAATMEDATNDK